MNSRALGRAIRYVWQYPRVTVAAVGALLVATSAQLAVPHLVQDIIDSITSSTSAAERLGRDWTAVQTDLAGAERAILVAGSIIIAFAIARGVFSFTHTYLSQVLSQNIAFELRNDLFAKIQRLSFSYHDRNPTGQLMIRASDDVEKLRLFLGQGFLLALHSAILLVGTLIILFLTDLRLTLVVLPLLPIAIFAFVVLGGLTQPLFAEAQRLLARVNTVLHENVAGLRVVQAFVTEAREQARFRQSIDAELAQFLDITRILAILFPFIFLAANLAQAAIIYFGGRQILGGTLSLGEWQKFSLYLVYLFLPLGQLGFSVSLTAQAAASAERVFEILDARNDVENRPGALELAEVDGRIAFENVTFRYFEGSEPVLQDVSFVAEPGQTVALLGSTGSGKSTVINLIPRFYDVSAGRVTIDGHDVREVTIESLRQRIGIVLQETTLFSGTIRDNIAFGRQDASMDDIVAAARAAAAHDFVMEFPDGYETAVGERGSTLSGGQKQRLAIARALLMDPHILILDDSTSSVDLNTEYRIQRALHGLQRRTSFVIAQRISTVVDADQILVLDNGRIVARGIHQELMENSPLYAEIYHSQLADDGVAGREWLRQ